MKNTTANPSRHYEPTPAAGLSNAGKFVVTLFEDGQQRCTTGIADSLKVIAAKCESLNKYVRPTVPAKIVPTHSERVKWLNDYDYEDDYIA